MVKATVGDFRAMAVELRGMYQVRGLCTDLGAKSGIINREIAQCQSETIIFDNIAAQDANIATQYARN